MNNSAESRIPLIYVLSNGRSGSTLLDLLLGSHPDVWTMGEAQILPWELRENRAPCGCGNPLKSCEFWEPLLPSLPIDQGDYPIEYFREQHNSGRVLRWPLLGDIMRRNVAPSRQGPMQAYGDINADYLGKVKQSAENYLERPVSWLVDASKDPYRLFWLLNSGHFDLRVIHLLKDPRAFNYSMVKEAPGDLKMNTRYAGRWLIGNTHFKFLCAHPDLAGKTMAIRYEDLAQAPEKIVADLGAWLNLDYDGISLHDFRDYKNHAVSGNPMRWRSTSIQLDEKWRNSLPTRSQRLVWAMTGKHARTYGYK